MKTIIDVLSEVIRTPSAVARVAALKRQELLTKPTGSLGELEHLAVQIAALQNTDQPRIDPAAIEIFAGDHGVASLGVSAYPQSVTVEMIKNFSSGGAAISILAALNQASLRVHNMGTVTRVDDMPCVVNHQVAAGTRDFTHQAAMTEETLYRALAIGVDAIDSLPPQTKCFIAGEMGIGNTTAASALACAILDLPFIDLVGPGTGLDSAGMSRKSGAIEQALATHLVDRPNILAILQRLGGLEIAAMVGAYIRAAQRGLIILVDGFICSVAALLATRINPTLSPWLVASHQSAEPGHQIVLDALGITPLIKLGLRLGEGSGAGIVLPLLRSACALHNQMATFEEAQVSRE